LFGSKFRKSNLTGSGITPTITPTGCPKKKLNFFGQYQSERKSAVIPERRILGRGAKQQLKQYANQVMDDYACNFKKDKVL
jgi:hypothetical protein